MVMINFILKIREMFSCNKQIILTGYNNEKIFKVKSENVENMFELQKYF